MTFVDAVYCIWLRNLKRYLRSKSRIVGSLGMPILFFVMLGFGLDAVIKLPGMDGSYLSFIVPGITAMSVLFTALFAGIQVIWDKQFGFLKETLVAPVSRVALMLGQTLGGATTALIQGIIILVIALLLTGALPTIQGALIAFVFVVIIGIAFTAMGIAFASRMKDMQGFQLIMNFVIFPIFGLSGAIFPLNAIPEWLRFVAYLDPLTYGVEGLRYGLLGTSFIDPLISFVVITAFALAMILIGAYFFQKTKL